MARHAEKKPDFVRQGGQLYSRQGNGRYLPVTEEQGRTVRQARREGGLSTAARSAVDSVREVGQGFNVLGRRAVGASTTEAEAALQQTRDAQAARAQVSPGAATAGQFAPDVGLGLVTGGLTGVGSTVARTAGRFAVTEGVTQAAMGAGRNPETPFTSGLIQGGIGAVTGGAVPFAGAGLRALRPMGQRVAGSIGEIADRTRGRVTGRPAVSGSQAARGADGALVDRAGLAPGVPEGGGVGAQRAATGGDAGFLPSSEINALGIKTTSADDLLLEGLEQGDQAKIALAKQRREADELFSGSAPSNALAGNPKQIRANQGEAITNRIMFQLGAEGDATLSDAVMRRIKDELKKGFDEFQELVDPQSLRGSLRSSVGATVRRVERNAQGTGEGKTFEDIRKKITGNLAEFSGRDLTRKVFQMRTEFAKEATAAYKAQKFNTAEMYAEVERWLEDAIAGNLAGKELAPGVSALDSMQALRDRWGIFKAIERTPTSRDASGAINVKTFTNNWKRFANRQFGPGESATTNMQEFAKFMETMQLLTQKIVPSSGTSERLLANLPGAAIKYGGSAAAAGLGVSAADAVGLF